MKYYNFDFCYATFPLCFENLHEAICIIGLHNIKNVNYPKVRTPRAELHPNDTTNKKQLSKNQLFMRGVYNIRKALNGHLGKNGKYSVKCIKRFANIKKYQDTEGKLNVTFPRQKKAFFELSCTIYVLLYSADPAKCAELFNIADNEKLPRDGYRNNKTFPTVAPIHTDVILNINGKDKKRQDFINYTKNRIAEAQ